MRIPLSILGCIFALLYLVSCLNTDHAKTVEIDSRSIEASIEKKCFIGYFHLVPISNTCKINPDVVNCWGEEGWKFENVLFKIQQTRLPFDNFFIKIKDNQDSVLYKRNKWNQWRKASSGGDPDLGYRLQVEDRTPNDTVHIRIYRAADSCEYVLIQDVNR